jgi:hypothetical protein
MRKEFVNQEFEYFTIEHNPLLDSEVIDLRDDTVAIVGAGDTVQINQLDPLAKSTFDYDKIYLSKQIILDLAEYIKNRG